MNDVISDTAAPEAISPEEYATAREALKAIEKDKAIVQTEDLGDEGAPVETLN